jgi:hypothetical protein
LAKGEAVELQITLNDGTLLTSRILTTIDKEQRVPYAIPSKVELTTSKGDNAYNFEAKPLLSQSPVVRSDRQVTVDFEYVIEFSKDKGAVQLGGSRDLEIGQEVKVDNTVEQSQTTGSEKTESKGTVTGVNGSNTTTLSGEADLDLWLFQAKGGASKAITTGEHKDWTEETSHSTSSSNTKTESTTIGTNNYYEVMEGENWSATVGRGTDTGYFVVKGYLTASDITEETMILSIEGIEFKSPGLKGFAIDRFTATNNKTVRWKK